MPAKQTEAVETLAAQKNRIQWIEIRKPVPMILISSDLETLMEDFFQRKINHNMAEAISVR